MGNTVFILSPARTDGKRAQMLLRAEAEFDLAVRLRSDAGLTLGEAFSFLSGLYFRGKVSYANHFGRIVRGLSPALVITSCAGLIPADTRVTRQDLLRFAEVPIHEEESRYLMPLERDVHALLAPLPSDIRIVLLGSVATGKYCNALLKALGDRLLFPQDFVGRGDMSRGGLMLRCVTEDRELEYVPVLGAVRHGTRPAKLPRK